MYRRKGSYTVIYNTPEMGVSQGEHRQKQLSVLLSIKILIPTYSQLVMNIEFRGRMNLGSNLYFP